jgi:hypothetical protein
MSRRLLRPGCPGATDAQKQTESLRQELSAIKTLRRLSELSTSPALQAHHHEIATRQERIEQELAERHRLWLESREP